MIQRPGDLSVFTLAAGREMAPLAKSAHPPIVTVKRPVPRRLTNSVPRNPLVWLVSFRARQQFFFQPSPARPELLDLRLESVEELDDLAVLATKRVEAYVSRH